MLERAVVIPIASRLPPAHRQLHVLASVGTLLVVVLGVDAHANLPLQRALGAVTWLALVALLRGEDRRTRVQAATVVALATVVEYIASPWLGLYVYRLGNVPAFVPPGHGLIYLAALAFGRLLRDPRNWGQTPISRRGRDVVLLVAGAWALHGVTLATRPDALGLVTYLLLARFLLVGRAPAVYTGCFVVTTVLELYGTALGNWTWAAQDPTGWLSIGNPPSGIAGAYCVFDAVALAVGTRLEARITGRYRRRAEAGVASAIPVPAAGLPRAA